MARAAAPKPVKSPRPTTRTGRATRNALSHGLFSTAPVIPGVESVDQWLAHLAGVIASLEPLGHLETVLAQRVAYHFWRLKRLIRYETQLVTSADPDARTGRSNGRSVGHPSEPTIEEWQQVDRASWDKAHRILHCLDAVMFAEDAAPVSAAVALEVLGSVHVPIADPPLDQFSIPGTPNTPLTTFDAWTAGLVRRTVRAVCQHLRRDPDQQLRFAAMRNRDIAARIPISDGEEAPDRDDDVVESSEDGAEDGADAPDHGDVGLYPRRSRGLPTSMPLDGVLERFTRFESHISRELRLALREFDYWQSRRLGRRVTHQLDLTASPNGSTAENADSTN